MRLQSFAASLTPPNSKSTSIQDALLERSSFSRLCFQGIIDSPLWIRAEAWKVLLGLLANDKLSWPEQLSRSRESYYVFVAELIDRLPKLNEPAPALDAVLSAIDKDIKRTHLTLGLFAQPVPAHPNSPFSPSNNKTRITNRRRLFDRFERINPSNADGLRERPAHSNTLSSRDNDSDNLQDYHWEALERLLYVYAALNPSHGYIQGMNQIIAPLYFAFSLDSRPDHACHAEADTFACFSYLMAENKDFLLDSAPSELLQHSNRHDDILDSIPETYGVGLALRNLSLQIVWLDSQLASSLANAHVHPFHYAYSWFLTLFGQSFSMPDLCRVFDSVFALVASSSSDLSSSTATVTTNRPSLEVSTSIDPSAGGLQPTQAFLVDLASAIVILKRSQLIGADFRKATAVLQDFFCDDVDVLLQSAFTIRDRRMAAGLTGDGPFLNINNKSTGGGGGLNSSNSAGLRKKLVDAATARFSPHRLSSSTSPSIAPTSPHRSESISSLSSFSSPIVNVTSPKDPPPSHPPTSLFSKYTKAFADSDAAASLAKASTNARIAMMSSSTSSSSLSSSSSSSSSSLPASAWKTPTTASVKEFFNRSSSPIQDAPFLPPIDDEDGPRSKSWFSTSTPPRNKSHLYEHEKEDETEKLGDVSFESRVTNSANRRRPLYLSSAARPAGSSPPPPGSAVTDASSRRSSLCSSTAGDGAIISGSGSNSVGNSAPNRSFPSRAGMRSPSPRTGSGPFQYRSSVSNSSAASTSNSNDFTSSSKLGVGPFDHINTNGSGSPSALSSPVVPRPRGASISSAKYNQQMASHHNNLQQQHQIPPPLPNSSSSSSDDIDNSSFSSPPRLPRFQKAYGAVASHKGVNEWGGSPSSMSFDHDSTTAVVADISTSEIPPAKILNRKYHQYNNNSTNNNSDNNTYQEHRHSPAPLHLGDNNNKISSRGYQLTDAPMESITPTPESLSFAPDLSQKPRPPSSHIDTTVEVSADILADKDTLSAGASSLGGVTDKFPMPENYLSAAAGTVAAWNGGDGIEEDGEEELEVQERQSSRPSSLDAPFEHEFPETRLSMADDYDDENSSKYSTPPRPTFGNRQRSSTNASTSSGIVTSRIRRPDSNATTLTTATTTTSNSDNTNIDTLKRIALSDAPFDEKALEEKYQAKMSSTTTNTSPGRSSVDGRRKRFSSSRRISSASSNNPAPVMDESGGSRASSRQSFAPPPPPPSTNHASSYNDETIKRLSRSSWRDQRSSIHSRYEEEMDEQKDDFYQSQQFLQQQRQPPPPSSSSASFGGSSLPKSPRAYKNPNSASLDSSITTTPTLAASLASRKPRGTSFAHPPLSQSVDVSRTSTSSASNAGSGSGVVTPSSGKFSSLVEIDKMSTGSSGKKLSRANRNDSSGSGAGNSSNSGGGNKLKSARRKENASTSSVVAAAVARVEGRARSSSTVASTHQYIPQASPMVSNRASVASNLSSSSYLDDLKASAFYSSNNLSSSSSSLPYASSNKQTKPQQLEAEPPKSSSRDSYSSTMSPRLRPPTSVAPLRIDGQNHRRNESSEISSRSPVSPAWDEDKILDSY